jgi:agmatinase
LVGQFRPALCPRVCILSCLEERLIDPRHAVQIGIRSPVQQDVYDWTIARGATIIRAKDELGPSVITERAAAVVGDVPAHLSFDVDALDFAFAQHRNTGDRRSGKLANASGSAPPWKPATRGHGGRRIDTAHDIAEITALAAATIVWEYLALHWVRAGSDIMIGGPLAVCSSLKVSGRRVIAGTPGS